ncbi:hypothetical protein SAMN04489723_110126 [Algoriphagus aquimarinus]|uniref:Uncharacterized protein n=1 Tax=Algoriphagus aquimarinus TaxID=237018 RepID=A0A1I1B3R0_9BACT|nr:hypothetical protein SAMN04489723_110126 [Algoriphagus aquimarinus]
MATIHKLCHSNYFLESYGIRNDHTVLNLFSIPDGRPKTGDGRDPNHSVKLVFFMLISSYLKNGFWIKTDFQFDVHYHLERNNSSLL